MLKVSTRILPRSLIGRVFALYCAALLVFVGGGLAILCSYQYTRELDRTQSHADSIGAVVAPTIADSVVIGDYDTIARTLERATNMTDLASADFIGVESGKMSASRSSSTDGNQPPLWLERAIESRLYETNLPIAVGGHDYGLLRLRLSARQIAGTLWREAVYALWLAGAVLAGGLLVIRLPLVRWLGNISDIKTLEETMRIGTIGATGRTLSADAPSEFRQTYEVLSRAAQTIQAEREQASVTLGAIADAVFTLDPRGIIVYANTAVGEVFGRTPQSLLGMDVRAALPELFDASGLLVPWTGRHARAKSLDGRDIVVDTTLSSIVASDGEIRGMVLACRDVTETEALVRRLSDETRARGSALNALRKVLEDLMATTPLAPTAQFDDIEAISHLISELVLRLHERGDQLAAIFDLSPDGFVSFDSRRIVNYVSPTFTRLTGLQESQVLGLNEACFATTLGGLCADPNGMRGFDALRAVKEDEHREVIELLRPGRRMLELGLRDGGSGKIAQVLYLRDVTHETEVERMKSEFLSTAAHELRTPMTSIYGFTELMMNRTLTTERQRQVIETVHRQTDQMITIVNELLDLARIEARRGKDFVIEELDLQMLVLEVVRDFKTPAARPAPIVDAGQESVVIRADRGKTIQVLVNVLSNAYKYSPDGGDVTVRIGTCSDASGHHAGVAIEDRGIGMTAAQLARLGERFYRADSSGTIPGTGLGMSIVKEVLELQGGRIEVESKHGRGTLVQLWLPAVVAAKSEALILEPA